MSFCIVIAKACADPHAIDMIGYVNLGNWITLGFDTMIMSLTASPSRFF